MSNKSLINILTEALGKKARILNEILGICLSQEDCLKAENPDFDKFSECVNEKIALSKEIDKIDEGFIAVYDRVKDDLEENKENYIDEIRTMKSLITTVAERTNAIRVREDRMSAEFKKKVSGNATAVSKYSTGRSNAAQKYAQTMQGGVKTASESNFINRMQ